MNIKKILALILALVMVFTLAACGGKTSGGSTGGSTTGGSTSGGSTSGGDSGNTENDPHKQGKVSQGVTEDTIKIGSNYCYSGTWAYIGVPVVDGMKSVFARINAQGGIGGKKIEFVHYDDQWDAAVGAAMVEKMVEEDEVFALNMLGGNVVNSSLDYLKEYGIPVVYISSTLAVCYDDYAPGSNIFPVQPEGTNAAKSLVARAVHESIFGANGNEKLPMDGKIGVIVATADTSQNALLGIQEQAEVEGCLDRLVVETVTADTYATAVQKMKAAGCKVVINTIQDTHGLIAAMDDAGWEVPFLSGFGTSTVQSYSVETYSPNRPVYCASWADYSGEEGARMLADLKDALSYNEDLDEATRESYLTNNYCCAGYFAAMIMLEGLQRIADRGWDWTWENLIEVYESEPIKLDACGYIDYSEGKRYGVTGLSFCEYTVIDGVGTIVDLLPFEALEDIMAK